MGSITKTTRPGNGNSKPVTTYRAFIRRTVNGKQVSKSKVFRSREQAKDWLRNNEHDGNLTAMAQQRGPTFAALVEQFVHAPADRGTKYWTPKHLEFWREEFGHMPVGEISRRVINAAKAKLLATPASRGGFGGTQATGETLTPATVNRYLASLSSVFNYAVAAEIIDVHPIKAGGVRKLTEGPGRDRILTADEERRLYEAAEASSWPMMRLFLRVLLTTGARRNEVLALKWEHLHFPESVAIVPETKNGDPRALPLVDDVKEALEAAYAARPEGTEYVFHDPRKPSRPKSIDTVWEHVRKRAGLWKDRGDRRSHVVLHTTRHTVPTRLLRRGANVAQVSKLTGHKTLAMLNRYTHLAAQDSVDLVKTLLVDDPAPSPTPPDAADEET